MDYDVIVAGGGPAGCTAARDIALAGYKVLVLEDHGVVGEPVQCAGLVSPRTLELAGVSSNVIIQDLRGMRVYSPLGTVLELTGPKVYAKAIRRELFDRELASIAASAGAKILCGMRVREIFRAPGGIKVKAQKRPGGGWEEFSCRLLIGADGHNSLVAARLGLSGSMEKIPMYAAEVELKGLNAPLMDVFLGQEVAPGWFGWVIPLGAGRARVGLGIGSSLRGKQKCPGPRYLFDRLKEKYPLLFKGMRVLQVTAGAVPLGLREKTYAGRVMLVGDAAGHVKPVSGGGLYFGLRGAKLCARVAAQALLEDDLEEASLSRYQLAWDSTLGEEIRSGLEHRQVFLGLSDQDMEVILRFLNRRYWREVILRYGDIDHPSLVAGKLSSAPPWAKSFAVAGLQAVIRGCSALALV